ncbi:hypothetical protein HXX76_007793 [Chlamydomonas incerta]|uniref:BTB domain-containing protein n=1 Tax=Chlamydomonas incerta TaxID=51695 RepID=A0A835VZW0_CHLIN|nr:hypothetical protein HXX76_007793 [Chlamydomonas incerta]|eukprot:KAG2434065.1 hypothetical protein HXX76_007793 [Chlamydomonas incerta]
MVSPAVDAAWARSAALRPEEMFAQGSRLSARADVRAVTADGKELWLHRMVLEMWSSLFSELCMAAEEAPEPDAAASAAGPSQAAGAPAVVSIHLSDTADELLPLLSCLYPTLSAAAAAADEDGHAACNGAKLDASTALPLLRLADKYDIPHVIATAAATMTDHVLPRLAAAPTATAAASYLQLPLADGCGFGSGGRGGSGDGANAEEEAEAAEGVAEWVVCAVEAAARLGLRPLECAGVELLASKFFEWGLQAHPHLLLRLVHCLPPDTLVGGLMCALTPPPPAHPARGEGKDSHLAAASSGARGGSGGNSGWLQQRGAVGLAPHRQQRRGRAAAAAAAGHAAAGEGGGGAGAGGAAGGGGGGGPRIVPVVIAAAGPAAMVGAAQPLLGPPHHHHAAAAAAPAVAAAAAAAAAPHAPQPLLQPHLGPIHPHNAVPVAVPAPVGVLLGGGAGAGGVGVGGAAVPAAHQPQHFAEVAPGGGGGGGGAVGVPIAFGAGVGAAPQLLLLHHYHNGGLHQQQGLHHHLPAQLHQQHHQQPEPFWGGGHAGGLMGQL